METIEFGKIVNTHGLKGEVKVYSYTDNEKKILKLKKVYIRIQKQMFLMKLQGIDDIDQTKFLMNEMCFREVEKNESNDDEGYFIKDLVGIEVIDESGNTIGTLKEVFRTGANDVYEVVDKNNKSIYLPAIKKVIKSIDISSHKMTVELMEGL